MTVATSPPPCSWPRACHDVGDQRHQLVAVDDVALLIGDDHPVGIAIERDADVGAHLAHLLAHGLRRGRAAFLVDVEAVRLVADLHDLGAELPQRRWRHLVAAPCAVSMTMRKPSRLKSFGKVRLANSM